MKFLISLVAILSLSLIGATDLGADPLTDSTKIREQGLRDAISSQQRIDVLADETGEMLNEYRSVLQQIESLHSYNDQLDRLIKEQNKQLTSLGEQTEDARSIQQHLFPLLIRMVKVLEELIDLDMPFLRQERRLRVENLKQLLDDPNASLPEKYRRVMEGFQIEMEYGRSIEAYRGEIELEGRQRTVDLLRIGRIALLYASLDGGQTGYWNRQTKRWLPLPSSFNSAVDKGLRIANKQAPPDLISVPLHSPERSR